MLITDKDNLNIMTDFSDFLMPGSSTLNGNSFDFDIENPFHTSDLLPLSNDFELPMLLDDDEGCGSSPCPSSRPSPPLLLEDTLASGGELLHPDLLPDIDLAEGWTHHHQQQTASSEESPTTSSDWLAEDDYIKTEPDSPLECLSEVHSSSRTDSGGSQPPPSPSSASNSSDSADSGVHCWLATPAQQTTRHARKVCAERGSPEVKRPRASPPTPVTPLVMVSPLNLVSIKPLAGSSPPNLLFTPSCGRPPRRGVRIQPRPIKVEPLDPGEVPTLTQVTLGPRLAVVPKAELLSTGEVGGVWRSAGATALHLQPELLPPDVKVAIPPAVRHVSQQPQPQQQHSSMEMKLLKKHQRMIKNRESACQSRRKKKEYVTGLEAQLDALAAENSRLHTENQTLRERLAVLEGTSTSPLSSVGSSRVGRGAVTALFAVLLVASLNMGPLTSLLMPNRNGGSMDLSLPLTEPSGGAAHPQPPSGGGVDVGGARVHSGGRALLWAASLLPDLQEDGGGNSTTARPGAAMPTCPVPINQTESKRLVTELRGWFLDGLQASDVNLTSMTSPPPAILLPDLTSPQPKQQQQQQQPPKPTPKPRLRRKKHVRRAHPPASTPGAEVALYSGPQRYASLLDAIRRRDDTFYVLSLSGDHLLLPARSHNHTLRPKVSLVMPTNLHDNGSLPRHLVAMMQIDCEVTDTRLIHIDESFLPARFRSNLSSTTTEPPSPSPSSAATPAPAPVTTTVGREKFNGYDPAMHYRTHKALFHHAKEFP